MCYLTIQFYKTNIYTCIMREVKKNIILKRVFSSQSRPSRWPHWTATHKKKDWFKWSHSTSLWKLFNDLFTPGLPSCYVSYQDWCSREIHVVEKWTCFTNIIDWCQDIEHNDINRNYSKDMWTLRLTLKWQGERAGESKVHIHHPLSPFENFLGWFVCLFWLL